MEDVQREPWYEWGLEWCAWVVRGGTGYSL